MFSVFHGSHHRARYIENPAYHKTFSVFQVDLLNSLYLEDPRLFELEGLERGISRAQMEFLAARASALLGCYY